jgi:hypothetical protein
MAKVTNDCVVEWMKRNKMPLTRRNYLLNAFTELPPGAIEGGLGAELEADLPRWAQLGYELQKRTRRSSPPKSSLLAGSDRDSKHVILVLMRPNDERCAVINFPLFPPLATSPFDLDLLGTRL